MQQLGGEKVVYGWDILSKSFANVGHIFVPIRRRRAHGSLVSLCPRTGRLRENARGGPAPADTASV